MADNSVRTPGTGETLRTLDRATVKTPVSLLDIARSGDAELLGLPDSRIVTATSAGLTTATTAYVADDQLGTELSFANAVRTAKGATIVSATLIDKAKIIGAVDLFLFSAATTPAADNAANAWSDADMLNLLGVIHFYDVLTSANNKVALATNLPIVVKPDTGTTIYGDLVTRTGHTFFGAVGDVQVSLGLGPQD